MSNTTGRTYAPAIFSREPEASGVGRSAFAGAIKRLFEKGHIKVEEFGAQSKRRRRLVLTEAGAALARSLIEGEERGRERE